MTASPEAYAGEPEGESYQRLREIADDIAAEIAEFERRRLLFAGSGFALPGEALVDPGPDVAYQMGLGYLAEVCKGLSNQFNREFEQ